jgi:uncharacterized membrane protein YqjE
VNRPVTREPNGHSSLGDVARGAAEDLLDLVTAQIRLARLEVSAELRRALKRVIRIALLMPPLVVGYAFAMAALASWLTGRWGRTSALAAVAALQIAVAGTGILWSLVALARTRVLERAGADMAVDVQRTIAAVSGRTRPSDG